MTENKNLSVVVITGYQFVGGDPYKTIQEQTTEPLVLIESEIHDDTYFEKATVRQFEVDSIDYEDPALVGWDFLGLRADIGRVVDEVTDGMLSFDATKKIGDAVQAKVVEMMEKLRISIELDNKKLREEKAALVADKLDDEARREIIQRFSEQIDEKFREARSEHAGTEKARGIARAQAILWEETP